MRTETRSFLQFNPGLLLLILILVTAISFILGSVITYYFVSQYLHVDLMEIPAAMLLPQNGRIALISNATAAVIAFLPPSFLVAFFSKGAIVSNLGLRQKINIQQVAIIILLALFGLVLSGSLATISQAIPLGEDIKSWAKGLENTYKQAMLAMMQMHTIADLLMSLFLVAVIPAFAEEFYFRGALQKILKDWSGAPLVAIIITAMLFSAIHFSFYGFLSRMALGILLGLIYQQTKSILLPILLHFVNNGVAITVLYFARGDQKKIDQTMDETMPWYWGILAIVFIVFLLKQLKKYNNAGLEKDIQ